MLPDHPLRHDAAQRARLWHDVSRHIDAYLDSVQTRPVSGTPSVARLRDALAPFDFRAPVALPDLLAFVVDGMHEQVHLSHPLYLGLFNPAPTTLGIAADALVAAFNPQLAAWSHAAFANEVERHLVLALAECFGYRRETADGTFCSGGAEANHTALLTALTHSYPAFAEDGLRALPAQPVIYVSSESHHSFVKAARFCGLGTRAVREVAVTDDLKMDVADLEARISADRAAGMAPCLVVATGGTTSAGVVDPIERVADVATRHGLWHHLDAAWGGGAVLVPELRGVLAGCERADSITFDAHKWLSVPMGAGLYLTRHPRILARTCAVTTEYMPQDAARMAVQDPFSHSLQWSRRFTGLKLFMSLAATGFDGYARVLRAQTAAGERLRNGLRARGWRIENDTPLPVVCFAHPDLDAAQHAAIAEELVASGRAWLSTTRLPPNRIVLRACITNFQTDATDVDTCVDLLTEIATRTRS